MALLKIGSNTKLGKGIASWNIPAVLTCPGRTKECESVCYANKGLFKLQSNLHKTNMLIADTKEFVDDINKEFATGKIKAVRIHAAGDFYSERYIEKWIKIVKDNPNVKFWAYTRSWRRPELIDGLERLSKEPNIQLFASIDNECRNENIPIWLRQADIVNDFDNRENYVQCPNQKNKTITCDKCTYCFKPAGNKKINVQFRIH